MRKEKLQELARNLETYNEAIRSAGQKKKEIADIFKKFWMGSVHARLNEEIRPTGYSFIAPSVTAPGHQALVVELYPQAEDWWKAQDTHHGRVDFQRADRLTALVNTTKTICTLRQDFPHIDIKISANTPEHFAELVPDTTSTKGE